MNQNPCELWEYERLEFKPGAFHYETSKPYRLWFEYLRLSPTYWLAHKEHTNYQGGLTEQEKTRLPSDFEVVREVYRHFGDIYRYAFRVWWVFNGARLFGQPRLNYSVTRLAYVPETYETNKSACLHHLNNYLQNRHLLEGQPSYMLLAVPLIGNRADILKSVSSCIGENDLKPLKPVYKLAGERFHQTSITTGLRLLWMKARQPKLPLWRLGVAARVSEKYAHLDASVTQLDDKMRDETPILESLTSRALNQAIVMMENAARGKFPCKDAVVLPELNYRYMWQNMRRRHEANTRHLKKTLDAVSNGVIKPVGVFQDWHDDVMVLNPSYGKKLQMDQIAYNLSFLQEQKTIHIPKMTADQKE